MTAGIDSSPITTLNWSPTTHADTHTVYSFICLLFWHAHIFDVMISDSLLTMCCLSVFSVGTNTGYLFQLRPALLSKTTDRGLPTSLSNHMCATMSACSRWDISAGYSGRSIPYHRQFAYEVLTQVELFECPYVDVATVRLKCLREAWVVFKMHRNDNFHKRLHVRDRWPNASGGMNSFFHKIHFLSWCSVDDDQG